MTPTRRSATGRDANLFPLPKLPPQSEGAILAEVLKAVTRLPHGHFVRCSGGKFNIGGRWQVFGMTGGPDVVGCLRGLWVGIECKAKAGTLERSQIVFKEAIERAGGRYFVVRSAAEAMDALLPLLAARPGP